MKISPTLFYFIWFGLQAALFNWALVLTTDYTPNFLGTVLFVLFFQVSVTFPVMAMMSTVKNENR